MFTGCSSTAEISCVCKFSEKYFCPDHFMAHRKENPGIRHMFSDIWHEADEENNGLCEVCLTNSPTFACLCSNRSNLLCQSCVGIHSKSGVSHSLEPLEAAVFVNQAGSIPDYFHRKSKVQKFGSFFSDNLEQCSVYKFKLKNLIESSIEKLSNTLNEGLSQLDQVERDILELRSKVEKAQFEYKLDLSDPIYKVIEGEYEGIEKVLNSISLFSFQINEEFFQGFEVSPVEVINNVKNFTDDKSQIIKYFDEFKGRMVDSVKSLFSECIEDRINKGSISLMEDYEFLAQDLSIVIKGLGKLENLDLSGSNIGPQGAKVLFSSMKNLHQLKDLNLGANYILDEGCKHLCEVLPFLKSLENLLLHKNALTEVSGKNLAGYLHCCRHLKMLSINQNTLGDQGLSWLVGVFVSLTELEAVGLQKNQLTGNCAKSVVKMLKEVKKLQDLSLDENEIDDQGALALLESFESLKHIVKIYIRNNLISEQVQIQLKQAKKDTVLVAVNYVIY